MAENVEAASFSRIEETVKELTQPEGVEASVAEITPERATTDVGEASTLSEEEATPKAGEEPTLQGEGVTIEARETSTPQDSPKGSTSLDLPDGKEVLDILNVSLFSFVANVTITCRES